METDTKLLENRILMLEKEEAKLLHKISNTRRRADEIIILKNRNEEYFNERVAEKKA